MTINRNFDTVSFWEVKRIKGPDGKIKGNGRYVLNGRIGKDLKEKEIKKASKFLEAFLSPIINEDERKKIDKIRKERLDSSMAQSVNAEFVMKDFPPLDDEPNNENQKEKQETTEESQLSIYDIEDLRQARHSQLNQSFKGFNNINHIGFIESQGTTVADQLRDRDYQELEDG